MDYDKSVNNAKWFAVGILVLEIIAFCSSLFGGKIDALSIVIGIAQIIVIIATINGLNNDQMYGAVCGIIVSILLILSRNIIGIIFGILYLIDCIRIVNYMKNN